MNVDSITTTCKRCGVTFEQPNDPGRRRQFCTNACRQADYRTRNRLTGHEAAQERKRREQARRQEQARKARERREQEARKEAHRSGADWTAPNHRDTEQQKRARGRARKLMERALHARTNSHEATACREKAETLRAKYGL